MQSLGSSVRQRLASLFLIPCKPGASAHTQELPSGAPFTTVGFHVITYSSREKPTVGAPAQDRK